MQAIVGRFDGIGPQLTAFARLVLSPAPARSEAHTSPLSIVRIQEHANLTIHLLRRCLFGPQRFTWESRWNRVRPSCSLDAAVTAAKAEVLCLTSPRQEAWPYDSALPAGLPRIEDGDTLPTRPDFANLPPIRPGLPKYSQPLTDLNSSTRLDALA